MNNKSDIWKILYVCQEKKQVINKNSENSYIHYSLFENLIWQPSWKHSWYFHNLFVFTMLVCFHLWCCKNNAISLDICILNMHWVPPIVVFWPNQMYWAAILDTILIFSKFSIMPRWHQPDSMNDNIYPTRISKEKKFKPHFQVKLSICWTTW